MGEDNKASSRPPPRRSSSQSLRPSLPTARDYMDTQVPKLHPDMEIHEAVGFLLEKHRTGAPVIDDDGELVGILTEFDCLRLLSIGADHQAASGSVKDFMTTEVITIEPATDIYYVAGIFLRHRFRRLPVLLDGKLVGAITRFDILRAIQLNR